MLDIKWIRENEKEFSDLLHKRGIKISSEELLSLDEEKRQLTMLIQQFQQAKNIKSKRLSGFKGKVSREFEDTKRDVQHINEKLAELSGRLDKSDRLKEIMDNIPNLPSKDVPYGIDESMNKFVRYFKKPMDMPYAKEHFELGKDLNMMDFEQTAKISGSRFVTLKGKLAKLERALISFMIDIHSDEFQFNEISPPILVKPEAMYNVGQLPKFSEDSYSTEDGKFRLIPTGEVPLTNMVADSILKREELPLRYVAYTECFRSEAGSAGRDTRGMIRNHQFGKVELVTITTPEESEIEHMHMLGAAEEVLKQLDIPYRVMLLCTGDMGFSARKTYDIEVWLPGQKKYREISSLSNCGDFQARRMKARYKEFGAKDTTFVHTLNGSGLAVGRTLVAVLENYQNEDGSITIPEVLRPYMGGDSKIGKV
ncbi:MAG: serine--tRNA ligase [Rickettsiaceae bacterium]|nr:serine--tRNA ligase [Rickettsiaceae bacterium]MDP5021239.1 serine--tRNA ligase [Rickettsiaceae bacterium]